MSDPDMNDRKAGSRVGTDHLAEKGRSQAGAVVLITGATGGIGGRTARLLAGMGHHVYGAGRRKAALEELAGCGVHPLVMDMTDEGTLQEAVSSVLAREGRIDVLINDAGYGSYGAVEDVPLEEVRHQFEVNLFGLARLTQLVLPTMRRRGKGRIINVSSMAGRMTTYMGAWYHATKYALEAFSDALRMETAPFGIDVVLVEPGCIKTDWGPIAARHLEESAGRGPYAAQARKAAEGLRRLYGSALVSDPDLIARTMVKAIRSARPKTRYLVGMGARPLVALHALLPDRAFDWLMVHASDQWVADLASVIRSIPDLPERTARL